MELLFLYFWLKLDAIRDALIPVTVILFVSWLGLFVWIRGTAKSGPFSEETEVIETLKKKYKNLRMVLFYLPILTWTMHLLLPTSKETAILVAGHYALEFSKSPEGGKVWTLVRGTANKMLDQALKEVAK